MADRSKKRFSGREVLEAIFNDEDSHDEQFDCGSDAEIIPDSENENDSDLNTQISQIIRPLDKEDTSDQEDFELDVNNQLPAAKFSGTIFFSNKFILQ